MAQLNLQNRDRRAIIEGEYVKLAPNSTNGFVATIIGEHGIIGTANQTILKGKWGLINLLNTVKWSDIINKPNIESPGQIIYCSPSPPANPKINDLWIDTSQT